MTYITTGKANFRQTERFSSMGNRRFSSSFKHILLAALMFVPLTHASEQESAQKQIEQAVKGNLEHEIDSRAGQQGWRHYKLDTRLHIPNSASHLEHCPVKLTVTASDHHLLPVGNIKRAVSCEDTRLSWRINVTVKSSLTLDVVVAKMGINRDQALTPDLVHLVPRTLTRQQEFYTHVSDVLEKTATRRVRSGQIITPKALNSPAMVEVGNQVIITASKDRFSATTKGIALEKGNKGEQITVQNVSSGKTIQATIVGHNKVQTQF
jgi:flagella basal body P-ring formation protein FlgA